MRCRLSATALALIFWAGCTFSLTVRMLTEPAKKQASKPTKTTTTTTTPSPPGTKTTTTTTTTPKLRGGAQTPSRVVHAFYYPWYKSLEVDGEWSHWNHEHMPHWEASVRARYPEFRHDPNLGDVGAAYYPKLGPYSSKDPAVIADHARQLAKARVGVVVASWYPAESSSTEKVDDAIELLLEAAAKVGIEVCVHLEPYEGRTAETVARDVDVVLASYGRHAAYHRIDGRPVFYAYDSYHISPKDWAAAFQEQGLKERAFLIALVLDKRHLGDYVLEGPFDAGYSYFGATGFTYCATPRHWQGLVTLAASASKLFIPCVAPGYDDRSVRPWNGDNARERQDGAYYDAMWRAAINAHATIVGVTSFNEWHEGTQIEEAVPFASSRPNHPGYADHYPASLYLDKTRYWVTEFD